MAIENSRFKTRAEREEEEKKKRTAGGVMLPTYEELTAIEEKAKEDAAAAVSSEKDLDFFQKPSNWDDGYQFGDVTKTALGTLGDVGVNVVKGAVRLGEGVGDAAQFGAAAVADLFGADDKAEAIRRNAQRDKVTEAFSGVDEKLNKYSVLGRTSDAAAESLGQIGGILATGGIAGALGAGAVGATAATTGLMGLSSFGSGTSEAYEAGAEEGEAEAYGAIAGAADALSEMIFGGLGKGFKALGLSKGITSADDVLAKAVTSKIRNTLAKNTVQMGIKAGAEGLEEVLAGTMQAAGKKATYMSERDFADILADENLLEQFVVGSLASGITQVPSYVSANRAGVDLVSDGGAEDAQGKFADLRDKYADFSEIERTGLASGAKDDDIRMAGELSSALGKKIRFFREEAKNGTINNGEYHEDTDEIWINARSKNVKAQIVAHELTHSIEKHDGYRQLVNMAMEKLEAEQKAKGKTIDDLYHQKELLYADGNVRLGSYDEITSELVAEFVEKRLLTDETSIKSLVRENRTLGQRIREWFDSLLAKMGNASAKERDYIRQMRDVYARALDGKTENNLKTEGVKHSFVGVNAEIDKSKLAVAERMEADGESKEDIRQKTGWFRSYDNKWRYEIDDSQAVWHLDTAEPDRKRLFDFGEKSYKLGDILEHDALYEAYPQLRDVEVYESPYASVDGYVVGRSTRAIALKKIDDRSMTKDMLLHELQHILQNIEGFATGASAAEYSDIPWGEKEWTALEKRNKAARKLYAVLRRHGESIPKSEIENNQVYGYLNPNDSIVSEHYLKLSTLADQNKRTKEIWDEYWEQVRILNRTTPQGQYHATAGEIEAYDTQARRRMTADERKAMRPNIDRDDAIVKFSVSREDGEAVRKNTPGVKDAEETAQINEEIERVDLNYDSESGTVYHSFSSLEDAFDYNKGEEEYRAARNEYAYALAKATGKTYAQAQQYLDDLFLIHDLIGDDRNRLDYVAAVDRSSWVGNVEYGGSIDFSTLCAKRRLFTGTFDAIQQALPDTVLNENDFLRIRELLVEKGLESPCSMCYVEGSRAKHGVYVERFLRDYLATDPEWRPQIADFTSTTRLEQTRIQHPEAYKAYTDAMNKLSQRKPKEASVRTDYKGEILRAFKNDGNVNAKNLMGGIRFNSFSDFEIIHAIDVMQVLTDMARVGLHGQSYTKQKEFAEAFGNTGLKINLSLVAKDVDADGRLIFDEVNGMKEAEAMDIRGRYSENVGTVIVVFNEAQLRAALADERIDFVLPFHRSQWKKSQYTMMGLPAETRDFTNIQNDRMKNPKTGRAKKVDGGNIMPNQYWDPSLDGRGNAQLYLDYINENDYIPKFDFLLTKQDGKWVLPEGAVGDGYFKLLIDFKMYDNDGNGAPQRPVTPDFNMPYITKMLEDYKGGHGSFPVANDIVDTFVREKQGGRVKHSVSREDASVTEAEKDQTLQQIRNDIAADEARYRELSDIVMSNERFNAMMLDEQNAILDEMQNLRERIDRANQIIQDMSYEQDMGDDVPMPGDENDPLAGVSSAVETEVEELDVNSAAYDGYKAQMPTDEDVYQSTAEQGMYDDMETEYAELIRDKRKEDADKRAKQKAKDRRVEERLNRQYEDALTWRFGDQTPISEERLMEDARTVESMGEREFLKEQGFGYRDMMDQMDEDAKKQDKEWRETQKRERTRLREVEDDLDRQFEQAEKERREINRRQREEDRKRRIERSEIQTVEQRLEESLRSAQLERSDIDQMRRNASEEYQMIIDDVQERYDALKNKNTAEANTLLRRISRTESRARTEDEAYQKRIYDIDEKIGRIKSEIQRKESPTEQRNMRRDLHESILYRIKERFSERGFDFDKVLAKAKDLSTFATVDNTPQRVMERSLGYKEGRELSDLTIDQAARNETEGIRWLNGFTDKKDGVLAKLSKKYNIKPGSKESAAAQMYAEGFYVSDKNEIVEYGDRELAADFPDAQVRENIKGLAHDPIIRQIYDETLDAINASRTRNAFPEIQKLDNYYLHFRAMDDTFSRLGIPFNPNDIRAKDLPTDLNGVTADLKPGQPYFASAKHRLGKRTSFDLLGGMEKYLTSAKNQIYHIDDIQTLRALRNYVADMYGQAEGLSNLDDLSDEEVEARIKDVYGSHLSTFAKFLNEEANVLAGKTSLIDRGLEGVIGRRGITFLNDVNRQVGANMVGYNISSSLTNFLAPVQAFAKMNKSAFVKGFAQTVENRMKSITGNGDDFAEKSDVIVRRKGADRFHRTAWQKMSDPGYLLMGMVDDISTEIIARAKYNELTAKGMDADTANRETDKWVSRLMGDRSLGQMPQIFNSKMLGLVTKFQLEVRNQLDSQFYDTIKEAQVQYEEIGDKAKRNAKTAAKVAATFAELALAQHVFGSVFESIAGYNPAFDIIEVIATVLGLDDDEDSEDTALDNIEQGVLALIEDLPYSSVIMDGGRIPVSSAMPIGEIIKGQDKYGNDINRLKTVAEAVPYYALPGGYGQIKKTAKGLSMFSGDKAVTGSYTDSGNLRFPVEATPGNIAQAAVFGQWANENARDYFDNERKPANERQTLGYAESGLEWKEFQRYRDQISKLDRDADKLALIKSLDIDQTAKEAIYRYLVASAKKDDDGNIIGSSEDERLAALYATGLEFSDYADAKLKQAELNADEGLTANQRATRFYAWAASKGYTDEQADAITEQFKFSSGFKVEPTQYKKLIGGGVSPDNAVLVTDALSGASRAIDKINAVWSTGLTGKQLDNAVKAVVTEGWYERYRKVIDANVPLDVLTWVLDNADSNGNDSIDNEERALILSQLVLSQNELSALWEATGGSEKSNPYKGTTGVSMPKIDLPKIELPKIELPKIGG